MANVFIVFHQHSGQNNEDNAAEIIKVFKYRNSVRRELHKIIEDVKSEDVPTWIDGDECQIDRYIGSDSYTVQEWEVIDD